MANIIPEIILQKLHQSFLKKNCELFLWWPDRCLVLTHQRHKRRQGGSQTKTNTRMHSILKSKQCSSIVTTLANTN